MEIWEINLTGKGVCLYFPVRLASPISIVLLTRLGTKWAEEEKSPSVPWNAFLLSLKYLPVVSLKIFKTNKAVLTIAMGLENILCWNLVKSALDKEDS